MPEDHAKKLDELEKKIDAIYESVEKTRKYFLAMMIVSLAVIVLPALGLVFAIPSFISSYSETLESLDLEGL